MWYGMNPSASFWVEVGVTTGYEDLGGGASACGDKAVFWAENKWVPSGTGYHEHYPGTSWSLGVPYTYEISANGTNNCYWNVWAGGSWLGQSQVNCGGTGRYAAAGIEVTNWSTHAASGTTNTWQRRNSAGTWAFGWGSTTQQQDAHMSIIVTGGGTGTSETIVH
jgi:hypothetical protein